VREADTPLLLRTLYLFFFLSLFFLLHLGLNHRNLYPLLLPGIKRDRLKTFTQCAVWSQFADFFRKYMI